MSDVPEAQDRKRERKKERMKKKSKKKKQMKKTRQCRGKPAHVCATYDDGIEFTMGKRQTDRNSTRAQKKKRKKKKQKKKTQGTKLDRWEQHHLKRQATQQSRSKAAFVLRTISSMTLTSASRSLFFCSALTANACSVDALSASISL